MSPSTPREDPAAPADPEGASGGAPRTAARTSVDVAVLGGGPAGLMAAMHLARRGMSVAVLEKGTQVGGMAGSFEVAGVRVDYGSHRLHPVVDARLRAELESLLRGDLQERKRRGRIALQGRWIGFPIRMGDMAKNLPAPFLAKVVADTASAPLRKPKGTTAADVIEARLGPTVARTFYVPYLTKLWDTPPRELAVELADRRVSARSGMDVLRRALKARQPDGGMFLYPKRGFGQISEAVANAATAAGASIRMGEGVTGIRLGADRVEVTSEAGTTVEAGLAFSTIPIPLLAGLAGAPEEVTASAARLRHRAMVLVYLVLDADRLTEYDAHYFPGLETPVSRLSEPKNFRDGPDPAGVTVVCAEIPCWEGDPTWRAAPEMLASRVHDTLAPLGFPWPRLLDVQVRKIPKCYPVYTGNYVADLAAVEAWVGTQPRLLTFGRQGLFAPDNTHHALHMGWEAADAVRSDGTIDRARWAQARASFRSHVVED